MKDAYPEGDKVAAQTKDRAQKIVAALYLLTDHIGTENPIRTEIRTSAALLLKSVVLGLKIEDLKSSIAAFLAVAILTKEISHENASILEQQLATLKNQYVSNTEPLLSHIFIQEKDMILAENKETADFQGSSFLRREELRPASLTQEPRGAEREKDTFTGQKNKSSETSRVDPSQAKKDEKKARRLRVLEHLSKTELKTIKDVSKFFTDCSEKTIQRELNDLVEEKIIVRVGDRRWSTYKLA